jgi:hypothetical protein
MVLGDQFVEGPFVATLEPCEERVLPLPET